MATIGIKTTQNVVIDYQLAGLRDRFFAFLLDVIVIGFLVFFLVTVFAFSLDLSENYNIKVVFSFFPIMIFLFYHLLSEVLMQGQTLGKKALGIKVVRLDGQEVSLSDYLLRTVFLLVDFVATIGLLGGLMIGATAKAQRLGDMTANTTVIRLSPDLSFRLEDILKINSSENYEPKYPEVKSLTENDMLLVKQVLNRQRKFPNPAHQEAVNDLVVKLCDILEIKMIGKSKEDFLKTLLRDYIVLTR